jgi:alpha-mannosidase
MRAFFVSHTHWDREWYRTFEDFRGRLVDAVDRVLDLCALDDGYRFLLDGQTIALEDYAEIRPGRIAELRTRIGEGRMAIGPWYVQPDSLLPGGEAHVRNLLLGRTAGEVFGPVSRIAYTPDSFGHPAQFPQLFAGFGLRAFVYWRGHGNEIDGLPAEWNWVAPDGTALLACHLGRGYFSAALDPANDLDQAAEASSERARALADRSRSNAILLMNGLDHQPPDPRSSSLAEAIAKKTGFRVERALLEDFVDAVETSAVPRLDWSGELTGARVAPLLPGVWSTRTWIKLANRAAETELTGWAEPFAALSARLGGTDERPALRRAWRTLLPNQAHDSICGCSRDEVHEQMRGRFDSALELARETVARSLAQLAGNPERRPPWSVDWDVAVFNPSPYPRTDRVRVPLDPHPWMTTAPRPEDMLHPVLTLELTQTSYTADQQPARVLPAQTGRVTLVPDRPGIDVEFVAENIPALGWKRVSLRRSDEEIVEDRQSVAAGHPDASIEGGELSVAVNETGTIRMRRAGQTFDGLLGVEDVGDRGDSYDFDPAGEDDVRVEDVEVERVVHPSGIRQLLVTRRLTVPARLEPHRSARSTDRSPVTLFTELTLAAGVPRIDVRVTVDNSARDHRLRLLFPVAEPVTEFRAQTTFGVATRAPGSRADADWVQRAPETFPNQGFVCLGGLGVAAPGLSEAAVIAHGPGHALALTLLRCVSHLSRHDLTSRPGPAGPGTETPGAQCLGRTQARLALFDPGDVRAANDFELGLRGVPCGDEAPLAEGAPAFELSPPDLSLSALKPAEHEEGLVIRVLNPGDESRRASLQLFGQPATGNPVRLDESPAAGQEDPSVPPQALRSWHLS